MQLAMDADGRVILPESLLKKTLIKDKALFVGKGPTFEIWQPEKFEAYLVKAKASAKEKRNLLHLKKDN